MQLYQIVLICLTASCGSNWFAIPTVAAATEARSSKSMNQVNEPKPYLRTLTQAAKTVAFSNVDEAKQGHTVARRDGYTYNTDGTLSYTNDDLYNIYASYCDGFRYELDENGVCRVSTGYIVLVVFINIAIVVAIVIASCACCKCCIWYPYLCCAPASARRSARNPVNQSKTAAYPVAAKAAPVVGNGQSSGADAIPVETAMTGIDAPTAPTATIDGGSALEC